MLKLGYPPAKCKHVTGIGLIRYVHKNLKQVTGIPKQDTLDVNNLPPIGTMTCHPQNEVRCRRDDDS